MPTENPTSQEALRDNIDYNNYTQSVNDVLTNYITPDFIDSTEELLKFLISEYNTSNENTLTFFRSFSERLINFLPENEQKKIMKDNTINQNGVLHQESKKIMKKDLTKQLNECGITTKTISNWFNTKKKMIPIRSNAFAICFALKLNIKQTNDFLAKVCFISGFNIHRYDEAIYYFCIKNKYTFKDATDLIEEVENDWPKKQNTTLPLTTTILKYLNNCTSKKDLLEYIKENYSKTPVENRTAQKIIEARKKDLTDPLKGYIKRESDAPEYKYRTPDSYDHILAGIYGINIRHYSKRDSPFPKPFICRFPDKDVTKTDDDARSLIILLDFYKYWMDLFLKEEKIPSDRNPSSEVIKQINADLISCNYPQLYPGNLYDFLFLAASYYKTDMPLLHIDEFRDFVKYVFPPVIYLNEVEKIYEDTKRKKCAQTKELISNSKNVFPNSIATPSCLAFILKKKYTTSNSLSEIKEIIKRDNGLETTEETMADWIVNSSKNYLAPLFERMKQKFLTFPDRPTAKIPIGTNSNYSITVYYSADTSTKYPIVIYDFSEKHSKSSNTDGVSIAPNSLEPFLDENEDDYDEFDITLWKLYKKNGTYSSTVIYSLFKTANLNKLNTKDYFEYLLTELPKLLDTGGSIDSTKLDDFLPWSSNLPENCRNQTDWW